MTEKLTSEAAQRAAQRMQEIRGAVARGWCHDKNSAKEMDSDLAEAISEEVQKLSVAASAEVSAMRALESLTVGGSEFVGDPARCAEYVREKMDRLQDLAKNAAKQRNEQAAEVSELREALRKAHVLVEMAYKTPQWLQECRSEESDEAREFIGAILKNHGDGI